MTVFLFASLISLGAALAAGMLVEAAESRALSSAGEPLDATPFEEIDDDELVIDFRDGITREEYDAIEQQWGLDVEFNSVLGPSTGIVVGRTDPARRDALLEEIRRHPEVESAEPLMRYRASLVPNDPKYREQWHLEMIGMKDAWELSQGDGVTVAVIDTGIAYEDHGEFKVVPDLKGTKFAKGYDFVNDDEHANDDHGHGTHVAGTIAQRTNNGEGVAGVAFKATLMPVKVLDQNGMGTAADIAEAIRWAADHGAKVLNLSLGGGGRSEVMASAVAYARSKGAVVVCAAGNAGRGVVEFPAAYPGAVAVSAVGPSGDLAFYSSFGKDLDIAAPGGDKRQGDAGGVLQNTIARGDPSRSTYEFYQGTSMATPHVAGVAALLFAAGAKSPDEVEKALFAGAKKKGNGWNERYGHGVLDAKGALAALKGGRPIPVPIPIPAPNWRSILAFLWAVVLWLFMRRTVKPAERMPLKPGLAFLATLLVATCGLFFLPWLGLAQVPGAAVLARPLPEWGNAIFGGASANPLFFSALIPFAAAIFTFSRRSFRGVLTGLAIGFGAYLLFRVGTGAPSVAFMPFELLSAPWLLLNACLTLLLGRALLRREGLSR